MTKSDIFAKISVKDLSRVAWYLSKKICLEYEKQLPKLVRDDGIAQDEARATLALVIWKIFCELKAFGQLRTRPEDLIRRAARNMRAYAYRGYPTMLIHLCRAFARQFVDFDNLPSTAELCAVIPKFDITPWRVYCPCHWEICAKHDDGWCREFYIEEVPALKNFGKYFVSEYWVDNPNSVNWKRRSVNVVPFDTLDEACFFITQLVDLRNTVDEPDCPAAAQFIRDTVAQAPVEAMRIQLEREAAERAKREEEERRRKEMEEQAAIARAKREESMRQGVHVYVLELDNDTVKIGISNNVRRRINEVEQGGLDVTRFALTQRGFNQSEAHRIEKACHEFFDDRRKRGEYFRISYEEAIAHLQTYTPVIEPDDSD